MIPVILLIAGLLAVIGSLLLTSLFVYLFLMNHKKEKPTANATVAVIVPCKGLGENLKENLTALCTQQYHSYRVIFVLDAPDDPAYQPIQSITAQHKNTTIAFAEEIPTASGKIAALIAGLRIAGPVDVYVFADSDIHPQNQWLADLVAGLSGNNVGATTGFRWFFPQNLKTALISTWNMTSMSSLFLTQSAWAWGGSTAIRRTLFEDLKIESKWRNGFSDDLILTQVIKKAGYVIKFIPACIVESPPETNMKKFLSWGTTQFTWVRWYNPGIWLFACCGMIFLQAVIPLGVAALIMGYTIQGLLMVSTVFFEILYGLLGVHVLKRLMKYPAGQFKATILYGVLMPLVSILFAYNLMLSATKKEITWAGKSYRKKDALGIRER